MAKVKKPAKKKKAATAKVKAPAKKASAKATAASPKKAPSKAAPKKAAPRKAAPKKAAATVRSAAPKKLPPKQATPKRRSSAAQPTQPLEAVPGSSTASESPIAATDVTVAASPIEEKRAITGGELLPRERSADPLRRSARSRPEPTAAEAAMTVGQTETSPPRSAPTVPAPIVSAPTSSVSTVSATTSSASTVSASTVNASTVSATTVSAPAMRAPSPPPRPVADPTWGALPSAPLPPSDGEFADFWAAPEPSGPTRNRAPVSQLPAPPHRSLAHASAQAQPLAHAQPPRPAPAHPAGAPDGAPGEPGQGRRRRRRRRRGGRGRELELGQDGREVQLDPITRRLRRQFNLRDFRPGQEKVIRDLLVGKDVLAIMPTGAGKSLTYQLTAFELPGVTVVVSPLLALMSDQLIKLRRTGAVAARLDSTEGVKAKRETLERIDEGRHKIIYVTPERAASGALVKELGGQKVGLFVVDEAHCVSEWGHDFRPAYLSLKTVKDSLPSAYPDRRPPVLALTATATPQVAEDILKQLDLKAPEMVHTGFNRPSLTFEVRFANDLREQVRRLLRLIRRIKGPGIVYCSTVRDVEALHGALPKLGMRVGMYHGRMTANERDESQKSFMRNNPRIMIATNAFGLGVDKPDIRFVIHYNVPGSIEAYYQEAGRAGRDGKASRCILLYNPNDEAVQEFFVGGKYPSKAEFKSVAFALSNGASSLKEIAIAGETSQQKARVVLGVLKEHDCAVEEEGAWRETAEIDDLTLGRAAEEYRKRREADRGKLEAMIRYARTTRCRVKLLLGYFGETNAPLCGRCDNCKKYGVEADKERTVDLMSPVEVEEMEDAEEPLPEIPQAPPPPRKDPTHHF